MHCFLFFVCYNQRGGHKAASLIYSLRSKAKKKRKKTKVPFCHYSIAILGGLTTLWFIPQKYSPTGVILQMSGLDTIWVDTHTHQARHESAMVCFNFHTARTHTIVSSVLVYSWSSQYTLTIVYLPAYGCGIKL